MARSTTHYCCTYPGCGQLVLGSRRCKQHSKRVQYDRYRSNAASRGYDHKWTKLRNNYLKQHPLCARCLKDGRPVAATIAHHIIEVSKAPELRLNTDNLMAVCASCHQHIHNEMEEQSNGMQNVQTLQGNVDS